MKTKIVYVLTFDESNFHFEQAMISVYSARKHNPNAEILIITDNSSEEKIQGSRSEIRKYVTDILSFDVSSEPNNMRKSRFLKTSLRNLIDGDYLFIDTDTIICKSLNDVDYLDGDICLVADGHGSFFENLKVSYSLQNFQRAGITIDQDFVYHNSGVMYVKDTKETRLFYKEWHKNWKKLGEKGLFFDQISLHMTDLSFKGFIKEISGEWNCQLNGNFINFLHDAYLIHYYPSNLDSKEAFYNLQKTELYTSLRQSQYSFEGLKNIFEKPLSQFTHNYLVVSGMPYYKCRPIIQCTTERPRRFRIIDLIASLILPNNKQ